MRLAPLVQIVVKGIRNPVSPRSLPVINNSRPTVFGDKARSTEHAVTHGFWSQNGGVPLPVHHVLTGNVSEDKSGGVSVNVVQVVAPLPEESWVGVTRHCVSGPGM